MKIIVDIPPSSDRRFKSWAKQLTGVDVKKTDGYAFLGDFLKLGRKAELDVGSFILFYDEEGSTKCHEPFVQVCEVTLDGSFEQLVFTSGKSWALNIRDKVAKLFEATSKHSKLIARKAELESELEKVVDAIRLITNLPHSNGSEVYPDSQFRV